MSFATNETSAVAPGPGVSRRTVAVIVSLLFAIQTALLVHSAKVHSPTWDEVGHLAAGLSHWELGRFELYSVNPPLVRTLAAAPVALIAKPEVDWTFYRTSPQLRSEVFVGRRFIEQHGEKSFDYFFYARLAVIPIALLGGLLCFLWARDLFGIGAGLVALTIWTFEPNVLAYGSVITPDLGAAVAMLGASYVFYRWLVEPSWSWALMLASVTSLAMLTKSVWLILPFVYFAIFLAQWALEKRSSRNLQLSQRVIRDGLSFKLLITQLSTACVLALVLTNGFYGFTSSLTPLGDFKFVSTAFSGNEPCLDCGTDSRPADPSLGNRFAGSFLGKLPVPLPANYLQGIDIQTLDFERGFYDLGWQSYLLGNWQQGGWSYYYVIAMLVKIPLAIWLMLGIGSVMAIFWRPDRQAFLGVVCLWLPAVLMFALVSVNTGLNRYMRYALPVLPVLFIWAAQSGRWLETAFIHRLSLEGSSVGERRSARLLAVIPVALCLALVITTLRTAPNYLSYFNTIAGGSAKGHEFLCDSNIDWGQDLIELKGWLKENPAAEKDLHLAYFGCFDPVCVGIKYTLPPPGVEQLEGSTKNSPPTNLDAGYYVVSKNYIAGHLMPVPDGRSRIQYRFFGKPVYRYFAEMEPVASIGNSMLVYKVSETQISHAESLVTAVRSEQ